MYSFLVFLKSVIPPLASALTQPDGISFKFFNSDSKSRPSDVSCLRSVLAEIRSKGAIARRACPACRTSTLSSWTQGTGRVYFTRIRSKPLATPPSLQRAASTSCESASLFGEVSPSRLQVRSRSLICFRRFSCNNDSDRSTLRGLVELNGSTVAKRFCVFDFFGLISDINISYYQ